MATEFYCLCQIRLFLLKFYGKPGFESLILNVLFPEEGEEGGRTSPSESPPKRAKTSLSSNTNDPKGGPNGERIWPETASARDSEENENVLQGSIVPASSLFQSSRGGLTITPAEPSDNDIDQSYNEDLADMLEVRTFLS